MKRIGALLAGLAIPLVLSAQRIRDVDITVDLQADGSARITQVWDVNVVRGTEWYIPIGNLDGMTVGDLSVSENGRAFASEGRRWDTERSLEQKAGRCGLDLLKHFIAAQLFQHLICQHNRRLFILLCRSHCPVTLIFAQIRSVRQRHPAIFGIQSCGSKRRLHLISNLI